MSKELRGIARRAWDSQTTENIEKFDGFSGVVHVAHVLDLNARDFGLSTLDHGLFATLRQLESESNPQVFWSDLFGLGLRAENQGQLALATAILGYVAEEAPNVALQTKARSRWGGITGQVGTLANRVEHHGRFFLGHAVDPAALAGMGIAGLAFQGGKVFSMARLLQNPGTHSLGGFGIRALSSAGGFAVEVPAFVAGGKLASSALGRKVDYSVETIQQELVSGALVLGALKLSGWGSHNIVNRLHGVQFGPQGMQIVRASGFYPVTSKVAGQGGMLAGIMSGHALEAKYFGHETPEGVTNLVDSLVTLLQFNVAGKMIPKTKLQGQLEHQANRLPNLPKRSGPSKVHSPMSKVQSPKSFSGLQPAFAMAGSVPKTNEPLAPLHMMMVASNDSLTSTGPSHARHDFISRAHQVSAKIASAQKGKTSLSDAQKAIETLFSDYLSAHDITQDKINPLDWIRKRRLPKRKQVDFASPEFNLISKILYGKSLTPRALAYRFGTRHLKVTALPFQTRKTTGFTIALALNGQKLADFEITLRLKKLRLHGQETIGWVVSRGNLQLSQQHKWKGYWTLMTLQLAEWARTGNFIAVEAKSSWDEGKASMADIFDVSGPKVLSDMKRQFWDRIQYRHSGAELVELSRKVAAAAYPWELMEISSQENSRLGYETLKSYPKSWQGILPLKGLDSTQWTRLLTRAFHEKKLWRLDDRFPAPSFALGNRDSLRQYYSDIVAQRYLSSVQRMVDHLEEYRPPADSYLYEVWQQYFQARITPVITVLDSFRDHIRTLQNNASGRPIEETLAELTAIQPELLEFKTSIRKISAHLNLDYLFSHQLHAVSDFVRNFASLLSEKESQALAEFQRELNASIDDLLSSRLNLSEKEIHFTRLEKRVRTFLESWVERAAKKLLRRYWKVETIPQVFSAGFSELIRQSLRQNLARNSLLGDSVNNMAITLASIYGRSDWYPRTFEQLNRRDLIWGMGVILNNEGPSNRAPDSAKSLEQAINNLQTYRSIFSEQLPLFLVRGSHFQAPILDQQGQDTGFLLAVSPSWGQWEGGIAFSLYQGQQGPSLDKGKAVPLIQTVAYLDLQGRLRLRNPKFKRRMRTSLKTFHKIPFPWHSLHKLVLVWAKSHGYQTPSPDSVPLINEVDPEWNPLINALKHLEFYPARKLRLSHEENKTMLNPFRIDG